jgi:hypothetical protein
MSIIFEVHVDFDGIMEMGDKKSKLKLKEEI